MNKLPPYPVGIPPGHSYINHWYEQLRFLLNNVQINVLHNELSDLQGGSSGQYYHLTSGQHTDLTDGGDSSSHYHSSDRARANHTGTQTMSTISDLPTLASGTYTPTLTNVLNLDASTAFQCQYLRVGAVVTVSGQFSVDPTATGLTRLGISLPIASNFGATSDLGGCANSIAVASESAGIHADTTNDRAQVNWITTTTANNSMYFTFTYEVI